MLSFGQRLGHISVKMGNFQPSSLLLLLGERASVILSPRKLHPVLRAERAKKDRFATGQKNYFFGCFMNVILDVVK